MLLGGDNVTCEVEKEYAPMSQVAPLGGGLAIVPPSVVELQRALRLPVQLALKLVPAPTVPPLAGPHTGAAYPCPLAVLVVCNSMLLSV